MKASGSGWCDGRRLGAPSIIADESLPEYPAAAPARPAAWVLGVPGPLARAGQVSLIDRSYVTGNTTQLLNSAEVVILCLPPAAVEETLGRITSPDGKVIDNSSAHRISEGWEYGLPELDIGQRETIRRARRVSGPGCFATGFILALRPLVEWGIVEPRAPVCVQGISGYSAGGKRMIERFERPQGGLPAPFVQAHGLDLNHPQVSEMQHHARLQQPPLFAPLVGHFRRGMLVCISLHRDWLREWVSPASPREALYERY